MPCDFLIAVGDSDWFVQVDNQPPTQRRERTVNPGVSGVLAGLHSLNAKPAGSTLSVHFDIVSSQARLRA